MFQSKKTLADRLAKQKRAEKLVSQGYSLVQAGNEVGMSYEWVRRAVKLVRAMKGDKSPKVSK